MLHVSIQAPHLPVGRARKNERGHAKYLGLTLHDFCTMKVKDVPGNRPLRATIN